MVNTTAPPPADMTDGAGYMAVAVTASNDGDGASAAGGPEGYLAVANQDDGLYDNEVRRSIAVGLLCFSAQILRRRAVLVVVLQLVLLLLLLLLLAWFLFVVVDRFYTHTILAFPSSLFSRRVLKKRNPNAFTEHSASTSFPMIALLTCPLCGFVVI